MTDAAPLVLAPMRSELRPVVKALRARPELLAGIPVHVGQAGGRRVTAALIGVGPPAARAATERLLDAGAFTHVVVSGIAGGIAPYLEVGALMVPQAVEDLATGERFEPAPVGDEEPVGVIGTTAELIVEDDRLRALVERGIMGLDMETAAVAGVCQARGVPWSAFRVVSDRPQDGLLEHGVFELLETDGSINLGRTARYLSRDPRRVKPLMRLARDSAGAARAAARAAVAACAAL